MKVIYLLHPPPPQCSGILKHAWGKVQERVKKKGKEKKAPCFSGVLANAEMQTVSCVLKVAPGSKPMN